MHKDKETRAESLCRRGITWTYSLRRLSNRACNAASSAESPSACGILSLLATGVDCLIPVGASTS